MKGGGDLRRDSKDAGASAGKTAKVCFSSFSFLFFFQKGISSLPKINTGDDLRSFSLMRDSGMKKMRTQVRRGGGKNHLRLGIA